LHTAHASKLFLCLFLCFFLYKDKVLPCLLLLRVYANSVVVVVGSWSSVASFCLLLFIYACASASVSSTDYCRREVCFFIHALRFEIVSNTYDARVLVKIRRHQQYSYPVCRRIFTYIYSYTFLYELMMIRL